MKKEREGMKRRGIERVKEINENKRNREKEIE
jgi:hypothetical protein